MVVLNSLGLDHTSWISRAQESRWHPHPLSFLPPAFASARKRKLSMKRRLEWPRRLSGRVWGRA